MKEKLITAFYRWRAKRKLLEQYRYLNEVNKLLEGYLTKQIISGGSQEFISKGRADLVAKQNEMKVNEKFIDYLLKLK